MTQFVLLVMLGIECATWAFIAILSLWQHLPPSTVYAFPCAVVMAALFWLILHHDADRGLPKGKP